MSLEWSDKLSVNVDLIDGQHKQLVEKINKFHNALIENRGKMYVRETLKFLKDYTVFHFSTEEELMEKYDYPDKDTEYQKKQHSNFVNTIDKLEEQFKKEGATENFMISVQRFILDWIILHISNIDKKLGAFLLEKDEFKKQN